jgi:SNF2 family DNA or RNA helicase
MAQATRLEKVYCYVDGKTYDVIHLYCRHQIIKEPLPLYKFEKIVSKRNNYKLRDYQVKACDFGRHANLRALYTLEMGLGKTIVAASLLKAYFNKVKPVLIVCKSSLTIQWLMELFEWTGQMAEIIGNSQDEPHPDDFDICITSMDMLRHCKKYAKKKKRDSWVDTAKFGLIILDEVQHIKNPDSQRTQLVRQLCARAEHVLGLSGTPIKNHAAEYFTILNILAPHLFPVETQFINYWVEHSFDDRTGKFHYGGIKNWKRFQEITKDFILRYTRAEVMPELPSVVRSYLFCDIGDELNKDYQAQLKIFKQAFDDAELASSGKEKWEASSALRESMNEMRQLIGLAKVKPTVEYVREFLDNYSNGTKRKIVVFTHHIKAADLLEDALNEMMPEYGATKVARMKGGMDPQKSYAMEQHFKSTPTCRVLVASTLACGEGKNFQFCQDAVMMERQWNPANEEQAESRFPRVGSTADFVNVKYIVARRTFDEPMSQLVERKRAAVEKSLSGRNIPWKESQFMSELMAIVRGG